MTHILTTTDRQLLEALNKGEKYLGGLFQAVEISSYLELYRHLEQLEKKGLIHLKQDREGDSAYSLTEEGREAIKNAPE